VIPRKAVSAPLIVCCPKRIDLLLLWQQDATCRAFNGSDGTRTRDLRRNRPALSAAGEPGDERRKGVSGLLVALRSTDVIASSGAMLDMLSVQTRTFSPTFSPTRVIQPDPASSSLGDLA
jgi:hypothetical protein